MRITFLGTSAGLPDPDRRCSSTLIEVGERVYIVDAGAPMVDCLRAQGLFMEKERAERIAAVFATHSHSDHTVGLLHLLDACTWFYRTASFDVILPEKELGEKFAECIEIMERLPFPRDLIRFREASAGTVYDDGILRATYIPTRHCEPYPSYAILIEAEGNRVLFSGDLSGKLIKKDVPALLSETELDLFICELAHFTPEELSPYLSACRAKAVCFNHTSPLDKIDRMRALASEMGFSFPIHKAVDGTVLELN